jgi:hypothetical protein
MKILPAGWLTRNERIACTDSTSAGSPSTSTVSGAPPCRAHALDQGVGAAGARLGDQRLLRIGVDVPGRDRRDPRGAPERLLGDVHAGAVAGGQEDEAVRIGIGPDPDDVERLDAAVPGRRSAPAGAWRSRRRRPDQDELALGDRLPIMDQALPVQVGLGLRDVEQRGIDLAVLERFEHRHRRPGNKQHGDARVGTERVLQALRQARRDERVVDPEAQRPAAIGWSFGDGRAGPQRRDAGGEEQAPADHRPHYRGGLVRTAGLPAASPRGYTAGHPRTCARPAPQRHRRRVVNRPIAAISDVGPATQPETAPRLLPTSSRFSATG